MSSLCVCTSTIWECWDLVICPFPRPLSPKNKFSLPLRTAVGLKAIQELSTTWWGSVTEEVFGKAAGLSRPFKKKVSSSPFPFT